MINNKILTDSDKLEILNWLKGLQRSDGGFSLKESKESTLSFSYYVFRSLLKIGCADYIKKKSLIDYIISNRCANSGFSDKPGGLPHPKYTSYAIFILLELNTKDLESIKKICYPLLQKDDGGFGPIQSSFSELSYTYYMIRCLSLLGNLDQINVDKVKKYIYKIKINFIRNIKHNNGVKLDPVILKQLIYIIDYTGS